MQDARFEMTNDLLGALFESEDGLTDFCQWLETDKNTTVKQKKTILEQLKELIQKAVERLKEYFNKEKFTDTQKAVSEMELKQAQQFRQQCLAVLDQAISNLENGVEISNGTKNSTDPSKRIAKNRKSRYDEFNTLAMQWAYSNKTNVGDTKVFNKNGKNYVLIEATEDGYIEIASGNYEKVRNINERVYRKQTLSFGMHFEKYRADEGGNRWDFVNVRDRRTVGRVDYETEKEGFQNNTTRNIKSVRSDSEKPSAKVKYSLDIDSEGNKLSEQQIKRYKNVAPELRDEQGRIKPFYHGTARADRVGNYFNPDRATSGPMAYFTDSEKIAGNYSRDKTDTSIAYDSDYDSYETQFRVNDKPITDYWYTLSPIEKRSLTQKIQQVTLDDEDNIVLDPDNKYGIGNFNDYELHNAKGNALQVLVDGWLGGGTLFGEEKRFTDVLNTIGIKNVEYKDPDYREEKSTRFISTLQIRLIQIIWTMNLYLIWKIIFRLRI